MPKTLPVVIHIFCLNQASRDALAMPISKHNGLVDSSDAGGDVQVLRAELEAERENSILKDRKLRELQVRFITEIKLFQNFNYHISL